MEPFAGGEKSKNKSGGVAVFFACVLGVILVAIPDYLTGYDVSFSVFYAFPVIIAVWYGSKSQGVFIALLGVIAWFVGDLASGHRYMHEWIPFWNAAVRFAYLLLIIVGAAAAKSQIEESKNEVKTLRGILPICTGCKRIQTE